MTMKIASIGSKADEVPPLEKQRHAAFRFLSHGASTRLTLPVQRGGGEEMYLQVEGRDTCEPTWRTHECATTP